MYLLDPAYTSAAFGSSASSFLLQNMRSERLCLSISPCSLSENALVGILTYPGSISYEVDNKNKRQHRDVSHQNDQPVP